MQGIRKLDAVRYEVRVCGPALFLLPLIVALSCGGLAAILLLRHTVAPGFVKDLLTVCIEACLPLTLAVVITTLVVRDPAIELMLSQPTQYRFVVLRRFALLLAWLALIEICATFVVSRALPWAQAEPLSSNQLTWCAPALWLSGVGALLALLMHSRIGGAAALGGIWISQLAFHGYFALYAWTKPWFLFASAFNPRADFWLANRLELLATAAVVLIVVWAYLHNSEWRFFAEDV